MFFLFFLTGCTVGALLCFLCLLKRLDKRQTFVQSSPNFEKHHIESDIEKEIEIQDPNIREYFTKEFLRTRPFDILWCIVDSSKKVLLKHEAFSLFSGITSSTYALQLFHNIALDNCIDTALRQKSSERLSNLQFLDLHWDVHVIPLLCVAGSAEVGMLYSDTVHIGKGSAVISSKSRFGEEVFALVACMPTMHRTQKSVDTMEEEFLQNVAHEIKNPLTAIIGFAELLHKDADNARLIERVQRHSKRILKIVEDIALLTQVEYDEHFVEVDIGDCIEQAIEQLELQAKQKKIRMIYERINTTLPETMGRASLLITAFRNVLENAIEHSQIGESVSIGMEVSKIKDAPHVIVRVTDKGNGVLVSDRDKIFDRFYRGNVGKSRARGGTGLGLAITKKVLELHGGTVSFESEVGVKTTFIFCIPCITV